MYRGAYDDMYAQIESSSFNRWPDYDSIMDPDVARFLVYFILANFVVLILL